MLTIQKVIVTAYIRRFRRFQRSPSSSTENPDDWSTRSNDRSFDWYLPSTSVTRYPGLDHPHPYFFPRPRFFTWIDNRYSLFFELIDITEMFFVLLQRGGGGKLHISSNQIVSGCRTHRGWDTPSIAQNSKNEFSNYNSKIPDRTHVGGTNVVIDWPPSTSSSGSNDAHILPRYKPFYRGANTLDAFRVPKSY